MLTVMAKAGSNCDDASLWGAVSFIMLKNEIGYHIPKDHGCFLEIKICLLKKIVSFTLKWKLPDRWIFRFVRQIYNKIFITQLFFAFFLKKVTAIFKMITPP